ncbi:glycosyltransferase family 9 protein [Arsenicibacter rosenii]|uniref:Glycosyltransferase family 9 protein n=1 Tax=Arsenicibacter rosenii TaxID=1750698 RepID=A0A1S2VDN8_9BACT|nr:glycosyltransferase family 9 protein [Arsenicibacter rosenii]OIN56520.1 hypothetical protein BLX24_24705 [Arsenicibacter rosenii]
MRGSRLLHNIDRYIGIPALFILQLLKKNTKTIPQLNRIAILRTAAIGDTVLLSAMIQDLKDLYPSAEIVFFAGPSNHGVVSLLPGINNIMFIPVTKVIESIKTLRKSGNFDLVIDTGQWPRLDAIYSFCIKSRYRIGFNTENQFKHYLFNTSVKHSNEIHEVENFRNLLTPLNNIYRNRIRLISEKSVKVDVFLEQYKKYVIFHLWSGGSKAYLKEWPTERWADLAHKLYNKHNLPIIITGSDKDFQATKSFITECRSEIPIHNLCGKFSLTETVYLISKASLLISVNTGVMHIGSALDIPVIDLHGPTTALRWGALNAKSKSIEAKGEGCGYINLGFESNHTETNCMANITVEEVYNCANSLL